MEVPRDAAEPSSTAVHPASEVVTSQEGETAAAREEDTAAASISAASITRRMPRGGIASGGDLFRTPFQGER